MSEIRTYYNLMLRLQNIQTDWKSRPISPTYFATIYAQLSEGR